jgi:hypothetical protein
MMYLINNDYWKYIEESATDILYLILKLNVFTGVISLMAGKFLPVPCKRRRKRKRI